MTTAAAHGNLWSHPPPLHCPLFRNANLVKTPGGQVVGSRALASALLLGAVPTVRGHHTTSSPCLALPLPGSSAGTLGPFLGAARTGLLLIPIIIPSVCPVARPHQPCTSLLGPHVQPLLSPVVPRGFPSSTWSLRVKDLVLLCPRQPAPSTAWSGWRLTPAPPAPVPTSTGCAFNLFRSLLLSLLWLLAGRVPSQGQALAESS